MARLWKEYSPFLYMGIAAWAVISVIGALWSWQSGKPLLQAIVTANEWGAALLLAPWFFAGGRSTLSRGARLRTAMANTWQGGSYDAMQRELSETMGPKRWHSSASVIAARIALVVFGMDLLVRGVFGLGWKPF